MSQVIKGYPEDEDYPGKIKPKRRGFPAHLARVLARYDLGHPEPNFVCEDCNEHFKLTYLKVHPGSISEPVRNLCRDCYKIREKY